MRERAVGRRDAGLREGLEAGFFGREELPKAREYLLLALLVRHADSCRRLAQTQERAEQDDVFLVDAELCGPRLELVQVVRPAADDRLHDVEEWAEGALTSALDAHLALGPGGAELGEQSRLADAGLAHNADDVRVSLADARPEKLEQRQLLTATDERPQFATASLVPPGEAKRLHRLRLALDLERSDRLGLEPVANAPPGRSGHEDLARLGDLLQARGDVDGVAHDAGLRAVSDRTGDDQAAVDADAQLERRGDALGAAVDDREHRGSGIDCAHGVVLVRDGRTEDRDNGIADELLDESPAPLDLLRQLREGAGHQRAQLFGVEVLGERREPDEIGEDDRDAPPLAGEDRRRFGHRLRSVECGAAGAAEAKAGRILGTTARAQGHERRAAGAAEASVGRVVRGAGRATHARIEADFELGGQRAA